MPKIYDDDNRRDRYKPDDSEYDRYTWDDDDKHNDHGRHEHEWINTKTGEQGWHGKDCSKEDKKWGGQRWREK